MKTKLFTLFFALLLPLTVMADDWNYICSSDEYYYGTGHGTTEQDAMDMALAQLSSMITTHVEHDFEEQGIDTNVNGKINHQSRVHSYIKTYSWATLHNVKKYTEKNGSEYKAFCYMKRSELEEVYAGRIDMAQDYLRIANEALERGKVDIALQHLYWAYALLRTLQYPNKVKTDDNKILVNWIPAKIDEILSDISVSFERRDGDNVDLLVDYKGKKVSSLKFTYNDGRSSQCEGTATGGRGYMEMISDYDTKNYHLWIEYEFKNLAQNDPTIMGALNAVGKKVFPKAEFIVTDQTATPGRQSGKVKTGLAGHGETGMDLKPEPSQLATDAEEQSKVVEGVIAAIRQKQYSRANKYFTIDGLEMYNQLIAYGTGRVVGTPRVQLFKGVNGTTVARGLQMSFSFKSGTKKTFVEDVVFTINKDNKIDNVAFGLGQVAENDILCKHPGWNEETRELLMEFLENYKTAYCLKRLDYIRQIFADDATIIVGHVVRPRQLSAGDRDRDRSVSFGGQEIIKTNRYTKDEYLKRLEQCFRRNEFVNISFTNNDIQWLDKLKDRPDSRELFAIQLGQEYNSTSYSDKGYLFLLVNLTNHDLPEIKIRTWQPNEVDMDKLYHVGYFYDE